MSERPDLPVSMILETNKGGVPATVCACGVLLLAGETAYGHMDCCPQAQRWYGSREDPDE